MLIVCDLNLQKNQGAHQRHLLQKLAKKPFHLNLIFEEEEEEEENFDDSNEEETEYRSDEHGDDGNESEESQDYLVEVLVEPGTPQGSNIISQMRSHILWMEKRRSRKLQNAANKASKDLMTLKTGAFIVAPCPHDGPCPLQNTDKYCHFVQRLERTSSQRLYKRSKGPLRGFEDEKFCYVAFRRGTRPSLRIYLDRSLVENLVLSLSREPWPLDGMKFETLKQMHAKRVPEDLEMDVESQFGSEAAQNDDYEKDDENSVSYDSDYSETDVAASENGEDEEEDVPRADLGSGWGRIVYMPLRRGKRVELDVCRATNSEGTEGSFDRVVITQKFQIPSMHAEAQPYALVVRNSNKLRRSSFFSLCSSGNQCMLADILIYS
ncbi:Rsm22-cox11 tandem protein 1, mitochondrial [Sesamum angolense]|uniref:Rsm22-cox11 tandem protein 1, mitochondrial n=1 Tax=Sesamum angolense TaxID=2727404 RepID=A0AAE2BWQ7_9LAMI|nr:Rsm22-cox11 tandem protein 1, mitochondrial [Sesamum angolense]